MSLSTVIQWLVQFVPIGTVLTLIWTALRKPKVVITGRRCDSKALFTIHYLGDFPLTGALTLIARAQGDAATLRGEPVLLAGPNPCRRPGGGIDARQKEWRASFDGLRPLSTWGLEVHADGHPESIELALHFRRYVWKLAAPRVIQDSLEQRGGAWWLLGGTALASAIYFLSLRANTGLWTGGKSSPASIGLIEYLACPLGFSLLACIPYYFCLRIWQNEVAPAGLTQGYLGWERPRRAERNGSAASKALPGDASLN